MALSVSSSGIDLLPSTEDAVESTGAHHLCVLIHGYEMSPKKLLERLLTPRQCSLWGNPNHLWCLKQSLREKYPKDKLHILVAKRNTGSFTYDGIETGGERVTNEIEETLEELKSKGDNVTKISIVGYSLGGLVARYTVGLLHSRGWFEKLQPINFTTFASPHLGVRTPLLGWHNHIWNVMGARALSVSGRQLFLIDSFRDTGRPLLSVMADANSTFIQGLKLFRHRSLYSNILNDRSVTFYTSYISRHDPFVDIHAVDLHYLPDTSSIILDPANPVSRKPSRATLNERLTYDFSVLYRRLPFLAFLICFLPIGATLFVANVIVQTFKSSKRIRLHEAGQLGVPKGGYRGLPLFVNDMRRAAESAFENVNAEHEPEYLPPDSPIRVPRRGSIVTKGSDFFASKSTGREVEEKQPLLRPSSSSASDSTVEITHADALIEEPEPIERENEEEDEKEDEFPTLALTPAQFKAIDVLDGVGWKKFPVYIRKVGHVHAAIIVRMDRKTFDEGRVIVKHWVEGFEG